MDRERVDRDRRAALAAYRALRVPPHVRDAAWNRLQAEIAGDDAAATTAPSPSAPPPRRGAWGLALLVAAALVLLVVGLGRLAGQDAAPDPQTAQDFAVLPAPSGPVHTAPPPAAAEPPPPPAIAAPAPAPAPAPEAAPAVRRPPRPAPVDDAASLEAELSLLRPARAALTRGDPAAALRLLDSHARRFPGGLLAEERMALRARALCERGERAAARAAQARLLAAFPDTPHAGTLAADCRE